MAEVQNPSVVHENNQGAIFLANNKQVGICTKHIDICHRILREVIEDKDMDIKYIIHEENPADITMIKFSDANYIKHMKIVSCPLLPVNPNTIGQPNSRWRHDKYICHAFQWQLCHQCLVNHNSCKLNLMTRFILVTELTKFSN